MKIVESLEDSSLLIKPVGEKIENESKEKKSGFFGMFLGALVASLLENMLTGQGMKRGNGVNREGDGIIRTGYGSKGSSIN